MDLNDQERSILQRYFTGRRLTTIPARGAKRQILLRHLATLFDPNRVYTEREVNEVLGQLHEDVASLRRYLVDAGYLEREPPGIYVRPAELESEDGREH